MNFGATLRRPARYSNSLSATILLALALSTSAIADSTNVSLKEVAQGWRVLDTQTDAEITEGWAFSLATTIFLDELGNYRNSWDTSNSLLFHDVSLINSRRENLPEVRFTGFYPRHDSLWFLCGEQGILLETKDWGKLWKQRYFPGLDTLHFQDVLFADDLHGLLVGVTGNERLSLRGLIFRTEDGGKTWIHVPNIPGIGFSHISYIKDFDRLYVTGAGSFIYSDDYGKTWNSLKAPDGDLIRATLFEGNVGIAVGMGGRMLRSTDAGESWTEIKSPTKNHLTNTFRWNPGFWYLAGAGGEVWETKDFGTTWANLQMPRDIQVNGVMRVGPKLFAWGQGGSIMVRKVTL